MKFIVVRHGQTNFNKTGRLQGQIDSDLTQVGLEQCYEVKESLRNTPIDLIISSPLDRTKKLAEIINEDRNVPLFYDNRLKERSYGNLEAKHVEEVDIDSLWNLEENLDSTVEELTALFDRTSNLLDECKSNYKDKTILLVTHSGTSIAIACYFKGLQENLLKLALKNCEITTFFL